MNNELPIDIQQFETELKDLLSHHKIRIETTLIFPMYNVLPEEVKLALIIISKHGGVIKPSYIREE